VSRYLVDQIERTEAIEVLPHTEARELIGWRALEEIIVTDNRTEGRRHLPARALSVFIGASPRRLLGNVVALDQRQP
jgi:thioredoxin reductase (NADPH)